MSEVSKSSAEGAPLVLKGLQTLFGDVHERKVVFCIDTSGSMFELLPSVKENLIETLLKMAYREGSSEFNLISFSSSVEQWSDILVTCNPGTVGIAARWIDRLRPTSGTNTLDALLCAFKNDPDAVYLVTDGMPDQDMHTILDHIAYIGKGRPVHCFLIFKGTPDHDACAFLKELAQDTFGSFSMVAFARHGCIERITPVHGSVKYTDQIIRTNDGSIYPNLSNCSVTTRLHGDPLQDPVFTAPGTVVNPQTGAYHPYFHPHNHWYWWGLPVPGAYGPYMYNPFYSWSRYRASRAYMNAHQKLTDASDDSRLCPTSSALLIGRKVLARRKSDGFYYLGNVKSQVDQLDRFQVDSETDESDIPVKSETQPHRFLVEFGPVSVKHELLSEYEEMHVSDIIGYDDAFRHPLLPGDRCLVPVEQTPSCRYEPATLMEGSERRAGNVPEDTEPITVSLCNGTITSLPAGHAVWIPNPMFHRLALESKMPRRAREKLSEVPGYPLISQSGYPVDVDDRSPKDYAMLKPRLQDGRPVFVDHLLPPYYLPVHPMFDMTSADSRARMEKEVARLDSSTILEGHDISANDLKEKVLSQINTHNELNANNVEKKEEEVEKEEEDEGRGSAVSDYEDSGYGGAGGSKSTKPPLVGKPRPPWRSFAKGSIPPLLDAPERESYSASNNSNKGADMPHNYDRYALLSELHGGASPTPPLSRSRTVAWQQSGPLGNLSLQLGRHELDRERRDAERAQFRRERVLHREEQRQSRLAAAAAEALAAESAARDRRSAQLERLRARQADDEAQLERTREHKREVMAAIRANGADAKAERERAERAEREVRKVELIRQRREERENVQRERAEQMEEQRRKLQLLRFQKDDARWREVHDRLAAEEAACRRQDLVARGAERQRLAELRHLEERQQQLRDLEAYSRRQNEPPLA